MRVIFVLFTIYSLVFNVGSCAAQLYGNNSARIGRHVILNPKLSLFDQINKPNVVYEVIYDFDLKGEELTIPKGSILVFRGGRLFNGLVVGEKMPSNEVYKPENFGAGITKDDTYSIQSCLNVCHNVEMNGCYHVANTNKNKDNEILLVPSETTIYLNGTVNLNPVNSPIYSLFVIKNSKSIVIKGKGSIVGDKETTNVQYGGHGMGISINGESSNISIDGISISSCFGDAIYIGIDAKEKPYMEPHNIVIRDCELFNCRRQGISIVIGHNIKIDNCFIHNIRGTAPESAIDIEPQYEGHHIYNVSITNSIFNDCVRTLCCGGSNISSDKISVIGCSSNSGVIEWRLGGDAYFSNCSFMSSLYVDNIIIKNSSISSLFYKGDNQVIPLRPDITALNSKFQVVGYVNPNCHIKMKKCIIDYPDDGRMLEGSPLRGGFLELDDCTCTGLGTNYKYPPEIIHLKATRCSFQYNKSACLQGNVLDLFKCIILGKNIEEDNALIYARKGGSKIMKCKVYYLNEESKTYIKVFREGEKGGLNVQKTKIISNNLNVDTSI